MTSSLFTLVVCPVLGVLLCAVGGFGVIVGFILLIGGPLAAFGTIRKLSGDATAVRYDQRTVTVFTTWKAHSLSWADVNDVNIMVMTMRMYGVIPVNRTYFLDFKVKGGLLGTKKLRVPLKLLGLRKEAGAELAAELNRIRLGAPNLAPTLERGFNAQPHIRQNGRDPLEGAPRDGDFDADAVIARYMANRAQAEAQSQSQSPSAGRPARVAGFGRKGI